MVLPDSSLYFGRVIEKVIFKEAGSGGGNVTWNSSYGQWILVQFPDAALRFWATQFLLPQDFVEFVSCEIVWASGAAAGNIYWQIQVRVGACGEDKDTHLTTSAYGATATGGPAILNCQQHPAEPLAVWANLAVGDFVNVYIRRDAVDALDTLNDAMFLIGLRFTYRGWTFGP